MSSLTRPTPGLPSLCLVGVIGLLMSCGPHGTGTRAHAAKSAKAELPQALPMLEMPMIATMSLIHGSMADEVRGKFASAEAPSTIVPVTFRLGPKMASHTFDIDLDGTVADEDLKSLRHLFRCRRSGRTHQISQGLLAKIADLAEHFEGHEIEVVSAYRHGRYASKTSRHRHGRAIDIKVVGIPAAKVRDYLWARYDQEVGVGFYQEQQFIHMDHRTDYPATAWTQKRYNAFNVYNPSWARESRRAKLVVALGGQDN